MLFLISGERQSFAADTLLEGLTLEELRQIPLSIGIVVLDNKARAVAGALKGNYLKTIIMDEVTAREVLTYF